MNWIKKKLSNLKFGNNLKNIFKKRFPTKKEQADSKYISCHSTPVLKDELENNLWTCSKCGKNHRVSPRYRFDNIIFGIDSNNDFLFKLISSNEPDLTNPSN